ncbi:MAG: hypothetical protein EOL97_13700 [Spirochaetia bacterium]|nr:hypothetical protein [Spirochaetia bacterium]
MILYNIWQSKKFEVSGSELPSFETFLVNSEYTKMIDWELRAFADKVKDIVCLLIGCTKKDLESQEFKTTEVPSCWQTIKDAGEYPLYKYGNIPTYRQILQFIGTDLFRNQFNPEVWINAALSANPTPNIIITDCRFPNEADAILERGGILIRLQRNINKLSPSSVNHSSETALDDYTKFTHIINNTGSIKNLEKSLIRILKYHNLI